MLHDDWNLGLVYEVLRFDPADSPAQRERRVTAAKARYASLLKRFAARKTCPHGVPMNGGIAQLRKQGCVLLSELKAKESAEILCVYEKDEGFLEFLEGLRLLPATKVEVLKREYDETMTLTVGNRTIHLGKPATSRIWVRAVSQ